MNNNSETTAISSRTPDKLYEHLGFLYPMEYAYASRASVFNIGLHNGQITIEEWKAAREYYGSIWHYAG